MYSSSLQISNVTHKADVEDDNGSTTPAPEVKKRQNPSCFLLIKSRHALKLWTWAVFLVTVLTCTAVIFASIWLMLDCRAKLQRMRAVLENSNAKYCTNLGLQVLFACCVVLLAVFGLGCIGRQMTGYAMMIISGVAFFQSAMTLVFNECQAGVKDEFLTSISSSLKVCRLGSKNPPFELMKYYYAVPDVVNISVKPDKKVGSIPKETKRMKKYEKINDDIAFHLKTPPRMTLSERLFQKQHREKKEDDYLVKKMMTDLLIFQNFNIFENSGSVCHRNSAYISVLAQFVSGDDVSHCISLCHIYKDYCSQVHDGENDNIREAMLNLSSDAEKGFSNNINKTIEAMESNASNTGVLDPEFSAKDDIRNFKKMEERLHAGTQNFDKVVSSCGTKMWDKIRKFCFYDNMIFMPLSLGGPVFYMLLSLAFMYLGYCDKKLKEPSKTMDKDKSMTTLIPASLSEPVLHGRKSTHSINNLDLKTSDISLLFESKSPHETCSKTNASNQHEIPKLRVVNERTSLDYSVDGSKYGNYGMNRPSLTSVYSHPQLEGIVVLNQDSNSHNSARKYSTSSVNEISSSPCTTANLVPPYVGIPSSSVTSNMTSESFMSDSD